MAGIAATGAKGAMPAPARAMSAMPEMGAIPAPARVTDVRGAMPELGAIPAPARATGATHETDVQGISARDVALPEADAEPGGHGSRADSSRAGLPGLFAAWQPDIALLKDTSMSLVGKCSNYSVLTKLIGLVFEDAARTLLRPLKRARSVRGIASASIFLARREGDRKHIRSPFLFRNNQNILWVSSVEVLADFPASRQSKTTGSYPASLRESVRQKI